MALECAKHYKELHAITPGMDKLIKAMGGVARIVFTYTGRPEHEKLAKSLSAARQVLRLAQSVNNVPKLLKADIAGGSAYERVMVLRMLFDALFCCMDNVTFLAKLGFIQGVNIAQHARRATIVLWLGFVTALIADLMAIAAPQKGDAVPARKRRGIVVRDAADMVASLANTELVPLGLSGRTMGFLALLSGGIATSENWESTAGKKAK